jgi:histidine triad (HIT) family protein
MTETGTDCAFCKIVAGVAPADVVHSSDGVLAFRDVNPQAPTHLVVIPKDHVASAALLTDEHAPVLAEIFQTAAQLAEAEGIDRTGWRFLTNIGPDAGQSVFHLHFHLLGGRRMRWPPG